MREICAPSSPTSLLSTHEQGAVGEAQSQMMWDKAGVRPTADVMGEGHEKRGRGSTRLLSPRRP